MLTTDLIPALLKIFGINNQSKKTVPPKKIPTQMQGFKIQSFLFYCANDILTCTPALVFTVGALDEM